MEISLIYSQKNSDYFIIFGSQDINAYCQTRAMI